MTERFPVELEQVATLIFGSTIQSYHLELRFLIERNQRSSSRAVPAITLSRTKQRRLHPPPPALVWKAPQNTVVALRKIVFPCVER